MIINRALNLFDTWIMTCFVSCRRYIIALAEWVLLTFIASLFPHRIWPTVTVRLHIVWGPLSIHYAWNGSLWVYAFLWHRGLNVGTFCNVFHLIVLLLTVKRALLNYKSAGERGCMLCVYNPPTSLLSSSNMCILSIKVAITSGNRIQKACTGVATASAAV